MHVGFAVFEDVCLPRPLRRLRRRYRHLAAGSTYCTAVPRQHGLTDVSVVPHGVDARRSFVRVRSSGHFSRIGSSFFRGQVELRKGQDIVIRAYKVLQDRHRDVMLVNSQRALNMNDNQSAERANRNLTKTWVTVALIRKNDPLPGAFGKANTSFSTA